MTDEHVDSIKERRVRRGRYDEKMPPSIFVDKLAGWSETRTDLEQIEYVRADLVHKLTAYLDRQPGSKRRASDTSLVEDVD
jgi:hypothetical protein